MRGSFERPAGHYALTLNPMFDVRRESTRDISISPLSCFPSPVVLGRERTPYTLAEEPLSSSLQVTATAAGMIYCT